LLLTITGSMPAQETLERTRRTPYRGSYTLNGQIHVNRFGNRESKPITRGFKDYKPSWSKTGDLLVFFRKIKDDPEIAKWKTAIHVIKTSGKGLTRLTDGTHTDFNPTWTRDGQGRVVWNRKRPGRNSYCVMTTRRTNQPGQERTVTDPAFHTWAYTCLKDGRYLVQTSRPKLGGRGYFLMTDRGKGKHTFEKIDCNAMDKNGILDRISLSPSETKICFEYQQGLKYKFPGRTLYLADFDVKKRAITNITAFANAEGKDRWFAYPRFTKDEKAIVYHASPSLYMYFIGTGKTMKVSTGSGDYRYPHCQDAPK
jgi:Tol biopolymer transport system component